MAIKRTKEVETQDINPEFNEALKKAFTYQTIGELYSDAFKVGKKEILSWIEHNDEGFEIEASKQCKTEFGGITLQQKTTYDIDKDALHELVEDGTVNLISLLQISSIKASDLKKILPAKKFAEITEAHESESFVFRATSDFKSQVAEEFDIEEILLSTITAEEKPVKKKATPKKKVPKAKPIKGETVEDEIDDILGK